MRAPLALTIRYFLSQTSVSLSIPFGESLSPFGACGRFIYLGVTTMKFSYIVVFAIATFAALSILPGSDDAQTVVKKAQSDRCAAFAAAGLEC